MDSRLCIGTCGLVKPIMEFRSYKNHGKPDRYPRCEPCHIEYWRKYGVDNKEKLKIAQQARYARDKERICAAAKNWKTRNRDTYLKQQSDYGKQRGQVPEVKARKNAYYRRRREENVPFRLKKNMQSRIRIALRTIDTTKSERTAKLVGCTMAELKYHLESLFLPGMTWDSDIHIDHIFPCAFFDLTQPQQQRACFNYTNLQPLWAHSNRKKSASLIWEGQQVTASWAETLLGDIPKTG